MGSRSMNASRSNGAPPHVALGSAASCAIALAVVGCADPAAEMSQIRRKFEQMPAKADRRAVAFVLGLPTAQTRDRSAWLYFAPKPGPLNATAPRRMTLIRFDKQGGCIFRELLLWHQVAPSRINLHYELSWTDPARSTDNDFTTILHEKLRELAQADGGYHLDSQPASYQLLADRKLLVGMQRWEQGPSRMVRVTASLPGDSHPRLAEAIELSCRVRVLSVGIEFDRPLVNELR